MDFYTKKRILENLQDASKQYQLFSLVEEFPTIAKPSKHFVDMVRQKKQEEGHVCIAEIGIGVGVSTLEALKLLDAGDTYHVFDYDFTIKALFHDLGEYKKQGKLNCNVVGHLNSDKIWDSYSWSLSKVLLDVQEKNLDGLFDVAYLDGAHTLYHDGTACCILKELMRKKGLLVLDDLKWSYAISPTMSKNPELQQYMTDEQIKDCQMKRVENLFMAHDARYRRVSKEDDVRAVYQRVW